MNWDVVRIMELSAQICGRRYYVVAYSHMKCILAKVTEWVVSLTVLTVS